MKTETIGAVIEIGSNSIKLLVATYRERVTALEEVVLESRISAGIGGAIPRLSEEGMRRGEASIMKLIERAKAFAPQDLIIAATSAVRDAENREVFVDRIHVQSSHRIRVLSGDEEADLIARGLAQDPELSGLDHCFLMDLGGGSMELLLSDRDRIRQKASLPLGAVRLTERFVSNSGAPLPDSEADMIDASVKTALSTSGLSPPSPNRTMVATGGTSTYARNILAHEAGVPLLQFRPVITIDEIRKLFQLTSNRTLEARRKIPGLRPERADIFPTALRVILSTMEHWNQSRFIHSTYNLRYGLAAQMLQSR